MQRLLPFAALAFILVLLTPSCELFDKPEKIPSFIHIDQIELTTNPNQGTASHKITDVWVIAGSEFIGTFELPATIPILIEGQTNLTLQAGIKVNGIASTRSIYPFYAKVNQLITLKPDSIIDITVSTTYDLATQFPWSATGQEGFEDGGISFDNGFQSDTSMSKTNDPTKVFEGNYSGVINLDTARNYYEGISSQAFVLPKLNEPVLLELNYKSNNRFSVGIYANTSTQKIPNEILIVNPSSTWNKIYINLTTAVSRNYSAIDYNVFIEAIKEEGVDNPEILLDNIKLVHF